MTCTDQQHPAGTATIVDGHLREAVARRLRTDVEIAEDRADRASLRRAVARALAAEGVVAAPDVWARAVRDLVDDLGGLGPLEALLRDPAVTDVMVNGPDEVHVERDGDLVATQVRFDDDAHVERLLRRVLGPLGVRLDRAHPYADAVLPGGVRLHALLPPLAEHPVVTLRRVPAGRALLGRTAGRRNGARRPCVTGSSPPSRRGATSSSADVPGSARPRCSPACSPRSAATAWS